MTRRTWLTLLACVTTLTADERSDALDKIAPLADALSNSDPDSFIRQLPKDMPASRELRENVAALMAVAEVTSSVEVIEVTKATAELDWYIQIRSRATKSVVERRRGIVKISFNKRRLESIEPASFFAPPADAK
ncbi:MAG: hypothetical protein H7Y20_12005 [Bryobacteraceae bacterium]|nr:hypothetical protein [Bryobacteraceae bacterium]